MPSFWCVNIPMLLMGNCLFVAAALLAAVPPHLNAQESESKTFDQRAMALLRGVENARLVVPSARIEIETESRRTGGRNKRSLVVWFDGDRRRFDAKMDSAPMKTVVKMPNMIHFDGINSCTIQQPSNQSATYCFDPRILGISPSYAVEDTVQKRIAYRNAKSVSLIGTETIAGRSTNHVHVVDAHEQEVDFWIEEVEGFPVHQYQFRTPSSTRRVIATSRYDKNLMPPSIPFEVETESFDGKDRATGRQLIRVTKAELGIPIDPQTWELAGLNLPIGTPVADLRLKQRIGYWNGRGLSQDPPATAETVSPDQGRNRIGWPAYALGSFVALAAVAFAVRLWRRLR